MTYIRHYPSPPLDTYVDYLYYLDGMRAYPRERILPTGWLDLEFNFGGAIRVYDASGTHFVADCVQSWWAGVWSTYGTVEWPCNIELLGIHFKPGGAYPFLKFPLCDLHNQIVSAELVWGHDAVDLREQIYTAPTVYARFALLEEMLVAQLDEAPYGLRAVRHAVAEIARHHGTLSIRALSDNVGVSHNHLLTQFKRMVGITPKTLARLHRLKHVLRSIDPLEPIDWALIAQQAGYYDQPHFNNDFMAFLGLSPTDYLRLRRHVYAANPERDRLLHVLPIE